MKQNLKEKKVMDKAEEVADIRPIKNLKTMKVIEKIIAKVLDRSQ